MKKQKKKIICILGMHRSGTSMISRILNICGVELGYPEEMYASTYGNERGHWENTRFMEINIEVIKLFSNETDEWCAKPNFPNNWQNNKRLKNIKQKAKQLVTEMDKRYKIWSWKDPRNCITLPFWQTILRNRLTYIIVLRQPLDIAKSLFARNRYPIHKGLLLWNRYITDALHYTSQQPRYFISPEQIFHNQEKEITNLIKYINHKSIYLTKSRNQQIKNFVDQDVWHHQQQTLIENSQDEIIKLISNYYSQAIIQLSQNNTKP